MDKSKLASSFEKSKATQLIIALLGQESMSFSQLMEATKANPRTLSDRIKELDDNNIISVKKDNKFPFKETIKLTENGRRIANLIIPVYTNQPKGLSTRAKTLLYMIFKMGGCINGTTRMEKLPFLLEKELGVNLSYHYTAMPYGPYSTELLDELNLLRAQGLLSISEEVVPVKNSGETKAVERRNYYLTKEGKELCRKLSKDFSVKTQASIIKLVEKYGNMSLQDLLDYVHKEYPLYKKNS